MRVLDGARVSGVLRCPADEAEYLCLDNAGVERVGDALSSFQRLTHVSLRNNNLGARDSLHGLAMRPPERPQRSNDANTKATPSPGPGHTMRAPMSRSLWSIDLCRCGVVSLSGFEYLTCVGMLDLSHNHISEKELAALTNVTVMHLRLRGNVEMCEDMQLTDTMLWSERDDNFGTARAFAERVLRRVPSLWALDDGMITAQFENEALEGLAEEGGGRAETQHGEVREGNGSGGMWSSDTSQSILHGLCEEHMKAMNDMPKRRYAHMRDVFRCTRVVHYNDMDTKKLLELKAKQVSLGEGVENASSGEMRVGATHVSTLRDLDPNTLVDLMTLLIIGAMYAIPPQIYSESLLVLLVAHVGGRVCEDLCRLPRHVSAALAFVLRHKATGLDDGAKFVAHLDYKQREVLASLPQSVVSKMYSAGEDASRWCTSDDGSRQVDAYGAMLRHGVILLSRAPSCPPLTVRQRSRRHERAYGKLRALLKDAKLDIDDLTYARAEKSFLQTIQKNPRRPYSRPWNDDASTQSVSGGGEQQQQHADPAQTPCVDEHGACDGAAGFLDVTHPHFSASSGAAEGSKADRSGDSRSVDVHGEHFRVKTGKRAPRVGDKAIVLLAFEDVHTGEDASQQASEVCAPKNSAVHLVHVLQTFPDEDTVALSLQVHVNGSNAGAMHSTGAIMAPVDAFIYDPRSVTDVLRSLSTVVAPAKLPHVKATSLASKGSAGTWVHQNIVALKTTQLQTARVHGGRSALKPVALHRVTQALNRSGLPSVQALTHTLIPAEGVGMAHDEIFAEGGATRTQEGGLAVAKLDVFACNGSWDHTFVVAPNHMIARINRDATRLMNPQGTAEGKAVGPLDAMWSNAGFIPFTVVSNTDEARRNAHALVAERFQVTAPPQSSSSSSSSSSLPQDLEDLEEGRRDKNAQLGLEDMKPWEVGLGSGSEGEAAAAPAPVRHSLPHNTTASRSKRQRGEAHDAVAVAVEKGPEFVEWVDGSLEEHEEEAFARDVTQGDDDAWSELLKEMGTLCSANQGRARELPPMNIEDVKAQIARRRAQLNMPTRNPRSDGGDDDDAHGDVGAGVFDLTSLTLPQTPSAEAPWGHTPATEGQEESHDDRGLANEFAEDARSTSDALSQSISRDGSLGAPLPESGAGQPTPESYPHFLREACALETHPLRTSTVLIDPSSHRVSWRTLRDKPSLIVTESEANFTQSVSKGITRPMQRRVLGRERYRKAHAKMLNKFATATVMTRNPAMPPLSVAATRQTQVNKLNVAPVLGAAARGNAWRGSSTSSAGIARRVGTYAITRGESLYMQQTHAVTAASMGNLMNSSDGDPLYTDYYDDYESEGYSEAHDQDVLRRSQSTREILGLQFRPDLRQPDSRLGSILRNRSQPARIGRLQQNKATATAAGE